MKITRFELAMLRIPLRTPFRTALRTVEAVEDIVLRLHTDDGLVGHGSAPASVAITGDSHASILAAIRERLGPAVLGGDIAALPDLLGRMHGAIEGNVNARAAVEIALHDLWGQLHGQPLFRLLGKSVVTELETDLTISVDAVDKMVADASEAVERGFRALKIKLGKDGEGDAERVLAIHAAVGDRALLRIDANQGWSAEQAVRILQALEAAGVRADLVEQPVPASDLEGLAFVAAGVRTPVMADESVFGPEQLPEIARRRAATIVNIKLIKAAGISRALQLADLAVEHGLECMIGCMLESPISVAAAAHVAAARPAAFTRIDLDGPSLCSHDPVHSNVAFEGPAIRLGEGAGLGIRSIEGLEMIDG